MQRRSFLKGSGVISILLAGGIVWRAHEQGVFSAGEGRAYEPWQDWRSDPGTGACRLDCVVARAPRNDGGNVLPTCARPRLDALAARKTWMAGTSPAMTNKWIN